MSCSFKCGRSGCNPGPESGSSYGRDKDRYQISEFLRMPRRRAPPTLEVTREPKGMLTGMANHLSYDALNRLIERRASEVEAIRTERHLAGCARCRSEREWLERIRNAPRSRARASSS